MFLVNSAWSKSQQSAQQQQPEESYNLANKPINGQLMGNYNQWTDNMRDLFLEDLEISMKIIIVGNGSVGKSSLIQRFCKGIFTADYKKTIGVDFLERVLNVNDQTVRLMLWDTAGQEEFDAITRTYYRGANAVVLACSITDRDSFLALPKWKSKVCRECGDDIGMLLMANKIDLQKQAVVDSQELENMARNLGIKKLIRTSVKEDLNVQTIFNFLATNYISSVLSLSNEEDIPIRDQHYGQDYQSQQNHPHHHPMSMIPINSNSNSHTNSYEDEALISNDKSHNTKNNNSSSKIKSHSFFRFSSSNNNKNKSSNAKSKNKLLKHSTQSSIIINSTTPATTTNSNSNTTTPSTLAIMPTSNNPNNNGNGNNMMRQSSNNNNFNISSSKNGPIFYKNPVLSSNKSSAMVNGGRDREMIIRDAGGRPTTKKYISEQNLNGFFSNGYPLKMNNTNNYNHINLNGNNGKIVRGYYDGYYRTPLSTNPNHYHPGAHNHNMPFRLDMINKPNPNLKRKNHGCSIL